MRLLLINPNTTEAMTAKMAAAARAFLPGVEVATSTGRFGAQYIASRASYAVAGHAALDCYARDGAGADAVLLACFGDPALDAIREVSRVPVTSLVEAACAAAGEKDRRFSIVTGGERWGPMLREQVRAHGLDGQISSIRTVAPSGGAIAADPEGAYALLAETCRLCVAEDGAEAVILGGAGLIGIAAAIQPRVPVPVICSVDAGLEATKQALGRESGRDGRTDAVATTGLSAELAALFQNGRLG
jgi:Asp/Glu/hydantoin racemase